MTISARFPSARTTVWSAWSPTATSFAAAWRTADCNGLTAGDVMSKPIVYCRSDEYLEDALRIMEKNRIRRLPVIDENKRLVGMLALGDISEKVGRDLAGEVMRSVSAHHA